MALRKPVNRRKLILTLGLPLLLVVGGVCAWIFLPRIPSFPEKIGNVLDVATSDRIAFFDGPPSRQASTRVSSGGTVWTLSNGKVIAKGLNSYNILSPDGERLISGDAIVDVKTKKSVRLETPSLPGPSLLGTSFNSLRFSNHGGLVASQRSGWLYILDAESGKVLHLLNNQMPSGSCGFVATSFSPDDKTLAAGDVVGSITLWSVKEGELLATLKSESGVPCDGLAHPLTNGREIWSLAFSPDGRNLASDDGAGTIRLWDVGSQKLLRTISLQLGRGGTRFTPDGQFLVAAAGMPPSAAGPGVAPQRSTALLFIDPSNGTLARTLVVPGFGGMGFSSNGDMLLATILNDRLKVDRWSLGYKIRVPFTSPSPHPLIPSDPALIAAYEDHAIQHLQQLQIELSKYRISQGQVGFPSTMQDLVKSLGATEGPFREEIQGYRYIYTAAPDAQGTVSGYTISATPLAYQQTGNNNYLVNQVGELHATTDHREAAMTDPVIRALTDTTQLASNVQVVPAPAASPEAGTGQTPPPVTHQSDVAAAQQAQHIAAANQWASQAEAQFQQGSYREALQNCEAALRLDPTNSRASQLKTKIEETMRILGKN